MRLELAHSYLGLTELARQIGRNKADLYRIVSTRSFHDVRGTAIFPGGLTSQGET
jgi:hypothetical protein